MNQKNALGNIEYLDWSKMEYIKEASADLEIISKLKKKVSSSSNFHH